MNNRHFLYGQLVNEPKFLLGCSVFLFVYSSNTAKLNKKINEMLMLLDFF